MKTGGLFPPSKLVSSPDACYNHPMIKELDDIRRRLIEGYDPDKIILFGSHVKGDADGSSDIDLVIVKATEQRPLDRQIEVESLCPTGQCPVISLSTRLMKSGIFILWAALLSRRSWRKGGLYI
jgi:hypothetical protein